MTIRLGDLAVFAVDDKLGALIAAEFPGAINGLLFGVEVPGGSLGSASLHVPSAFRVRHHVVGLSGHSSIPPHYIGRKGLSVFFLDTPAHCGSSVGDVPLLKIKGREVRKFST
jgi:hypothetical protein